MSEFTVEGTFQARDGHQSFERTVEAPNEDVAREHVLSSLGSEHGLERTQVEVREVQG